MLSPLARPASLAALGLIAALLIPTPASARRPHPGASVQVHRAMRDATHFTARNLTMGTHGVQAVATPGQSVAGTLELAHHHGFARTGPSQVLIGFAGQPYAQACVYEGRGALNGFQSVPFTLVAPQVPGAYEIRVRYVHGYSCNDALRQWNRLAPSAAHDRTLGVLVVHPALAPVRDVSLIMADMDAVLADSDRRITRLQQLSSRPVSGKRLRKLQKISADLSALNHRLMDLRGELGMALGGVQPVAYAAPNIVILDTHLPPLPQVMQPQVVVHQPMEPVYAPAPALYPMTARDFRRLLARIKKAAFADDQKATLNDTIQAGAYFSTHQALELIKRFPFEDDKIEVVVTLCDVIIEPGALPDLIDAFTFSSGKDAVRARTHGRCGHPSSFR